MSSVSIQNEHALYEFIKSNMHEWFAFPLWLLEGPLGVGKTTFVKQLLSLIDKEFSNVRSPSFALVHTYDTKSYKIIHADFYRLEKANLDDFGFQEWLGVPKTICIVEWPEKLSHIPRPYIHFKYEFNAESVRTLTVTSWK
jgi:tRNA threonylcarbamoyladenosine biosynthesis protein TsaE